MREFNIRTVPQAFPGTPVDLSVRVGQGGAILDHITIHVDSAPVSAGSLTVTLDSVDGPEFDTILATIDLNGVTDHLEVFNLALQTGDVVKLAYTNSDGRTVGCRVALRE
jgi:hypothetical protein